MQIFLKHIYGNYIYPQFKNGIKTFWMWTNFLRYDKENYVYIKYDNLNDVVDYCKKHKKENEIIIWEFSENGVFLSKNNK